MRLVGRNTHLFMQALLGALLVQKSISLNVAKNLFSGLKNISFKGRSGGGPATVVTTIAAPLIIPKTKSDLLNAISFTNNGKDASLEIQKKVLQLVSTLEKEAPVSENLLIDPKEAQILDGVWYLQYTAPSSIGLSETDTWQPEDSSEGPSKIDTKAYNIQGSVGAAGIVVETSNRLTTQVFDVEKSRVSNNVEQDFGTITVEGAFRRSETVKRRAVVAFDKCEITLNNGIALNLGFVFSMIAALKGGIKDNGWLETTYVDSDLRIGRGNKGTLFLLTRDRNAVRP